MEKTTGQTLENYKIEPFTLIHDILVNWWVILLAALSAAMISSVVLNIRYVPQYTTSATFVVSYRNSSASYSSLGYGEYNGHHISEDSREFSHAGYPLQETGCGRG